MSHVNAEKAVAGAGKMMDSMMGKMDMGSMMKEGMGPMMMGGMGSMMKTPGVATGAVVTAGSAAGKSVLKKVFTHPVVLFGLGVAAGYLIYKYRKSIISTAEEAQEEE